MTATDAADPMTPAQFAEALEVIATDVADLQLTPTPTMQAALDALLAEVGALRRASEEGEAVE